MTKVTVVCRYCGATREVQASYAGRYATCGSPECVLKRRQEGGGKSKGKGTANPRFVDGRWTRIEQACAICGTVFVGPAKRKFCSLKCASADKAAKQAGQTFTDERKSKMKGRSGTGPKSEEWIAGIRGAGNPSWKGGITPINKRGRSLIAYHTWRRDVLARDGGTCRICGATNPLTAHHLKPYAAFPDLRYEVSNGVTLCWPCHSSYHQGLIALPDC